MPSSRQPGSGSTVGAQPEPIGDAASPHGSGTLAALVDRSPLAILVHDAGGRVVRWNCAAEATFGWTEAEIAGRPSPVVLEGPEGDALHRAILRGEEVVGVEVRAIHRAGHRLDVAVWASGHFDSEGELVATLASFADVTHRRAHERALAESRDQLQHAQRMEAIGRLAGGVAHDFNNLLTVILSYASTGAADLAPGHPVRQDLEQIEAAALRASGLIRQLLTFGRRQVVQPRSLDLNATVDGLCHLLGRLLGEDVRLFTVLDPSLPRVWADAGSVEQIIINLAVNARDAMLRGGSLRIETSARSLDPRDAASVGVLPGRYALVTVADDGAGMDEETRARAFDPYFTTKEVGQGSGLGLSWIYGAVAQMAGAVLVQSALGEGTTVEVYLPTINHEDPQLGQSPSGEEAAKGCVLLVEDDELVRRLAHSVLRRAGYKVFEAQNSGEALLLAGRHLDEVSLVLSDVVMPHMSGPELVERLREERPELPCLFMSGYTSGVLTSQGRDRIEPLLEKPFTASELLARIDEVLVDPR